MKPTPFYPSIDKLLKDLNGQLPSYGHLLSTFEWKQLRAAIIKRDKNCCTQCGVTPTEFIMGRHFRDYSDIEVDRLIKSGSQIYTMNDMIDSETGYAGSTFSEYPIYLHVHHQYYIFGKYPWQYEESALTTLCNKCHIELHEHSKIPYYQDEARKIEMNLQPCIRCNGAGHFEEYSHIENGICFSCRGAKYVELIGQYAVS
ncbi:hypothetical protein [Dyadobacter soli]|uniref:hypothetical protein n=1 Tax=Dyadobacter soli TaxID=659014 RepID=UPI00116004A8|nr:hypothetical protein [Dyadobacter soli]